MAKRGRPRKFASLDGLVGELKALDARRVAVVDQLRRATEALFSGENPFPWRQQSGSKKKRGPGRPAGKRKMSAAARKRISEAQKARWAKQKRKGSKRSAKLKSSGGGSSVGNG